MEILELFGVDWKILIAQLVNFSIVVIILWLFAIKPLMKTMKERNEEIEKGLKDAQEAANYLEKTEENIKEKLKESKEESLAILAEAKKQSDLDKQDSINNTKEEIESIIKKAKEQINKEKESMLEEAKSELSQSLVLTLEKVLSKELSKEIDKKYIAKVIKEINEKR